MSKTENLKDAQIQMQHFLHACLPEKYQADAHKLLLACVEAATAVPSTVEEKLTLGQPMRIVCPLCGSERTALLMTRVMQCGMELTVMNNGAEQKKTREYPMLGYAVHLTMACRPSGHIFSLDVGSPLHDALMISMHDIEDQYDKQTIDIAEFWRHRTSFMPPAYIAVKNRQRQELFHNADKATDPHQRATLWAKCIAETKFKLRDVRPNMTIAGIATLSDAEANQLADDIRQYLEDQILKPA